MRLKALYRAKSSKAAASDSEGGNTLGKRRREAKTEKEDEYLRTQEIRLDIPETLKGQLVDDWESVTKNQQLVTLPRQVTINDVLARYKKFKKEKKGNREL